MLRRKSLIGAAIASLLLGWFGYRAIADRETALAEEKPIVVASYSVLCDLIATIAEDTIDLTCLIDPGQAPHSYRPTPSERKAIEESQLTFYGGYNLEPQIIKLIQATKTQIPPIAVHEVVVSQPIMTEHHHEVEEEGQENRDRTDAESENHSANSQSEKPAAEKKDKEPDSHIWHDVRNTIAMVELIQSVFIQFNPNQAEVYLGNAAALTDKLYKLNLWIEEQIATIPEGKRILVTTHNSLNYYVKAYELEDYKTIQGISPDESPTTTRVRELVTEIKAAQIPTMFAEATGSDRVLNTIARETDVKISAQKLFTDSLGEAGTPEGTYIGMMESNTCAIVNGLGGKCKPFEEK